MLVVIGLVALALRLADELLLVEVDLGVLTLNLLIDLLIR